jgi:hypothetical protein
MVSENGKSFVILELKEAIEKYGISTDDMMTALETGAEIKSPLTGSSIVVDEPFDED